MTIQNVTFSVVIGGTDYSANVISINRKADLCTPGQTFEIQLDPSLSYSSLTTYQSTTISENGVTVLTGYTSSISKERTPNKVTVKGSDTYKRCQDTSLDDDVMTNGETIAYWIDYLCTLAGVSYSIDGTGSGLVVYGNIPLGLKTVGEAFNSIANYAGWVILVYPDGVVHFTNIGSVTDRVFYTLKGSRSIGDTDTRTSAVVWGMLGTNYQESRAIAGSGSGRVMVLADPMITDTDTAKYIANYLLNQFASLDDTLIIEILGDPSIVVGQVATLDFSGSYTNTITKVESIIDIHGYRMSVTLGRKCLNMAAVTPAQGVVYAGTERYLARSYNFYTSGSTVWSDIWNNSSGSRSGLECFVLDNYRPSSYGYASGSFGIVRTTNLAGSPPNWSMVHSPTQFNTAVGDKLWTVTNIRSAQYQGVLYAQALSTGGSIWVGKSTDYGSTWSWSGAIDVVTSASSSSGVPSLGFNVRGANEVWSTGNSGSLLYCSTGSSGLNFRAIYTVPVATGPINNIVTGGSNIFIGGGQSFMPYTAPQYASSINSVGSVSNPSNITGAPDYNYAVFPGNDAGSLLNVKNIKGTTFTGGSTVVRLYATTATTGYLTLYSYSNSGISYTISGTQRPTPWLYLPMIRNDTRPSFTVSNVGLTDVSIDAIEYYPISGPIRYRNGRILYNNGAYYVEGHGSWLGVGDAKLDDWARSYEIEFYLDNLYKGAVVEISFSCLASDYSPAPLYSGMYERVTNQSADPEYPNGMNAGETIVFQFTSNFGGVWDGSTPFYFSQGYCYRGRYKINYIKVDGTEVFLGGVSYVKRSLVSSGSLFVDITPVTGGATYLRSLSATDNNPTSALAMGDTSGCVSGTTDLGSTWPSIAGLYSNGNNVSQNGYNYKRDYWLDDNGIYYSGDFMASSIKNKTGNWQSVYGYSFLNSGIKKVLVAQVVQ